MTIAVTLQLVGAWYLFSLHKRPKPTDASNNNYGYQSSGIISSSSSISSSSYMSSSGDSALIGKGVSVSIVVPIFNSTTFIKPCLESLFSQTLSDIEIIFVDDRGTDDSIQIIKNFTASHPNVKHVQVLRNPKNVGPGPSRNAGIEAASGEYVGFVDPDDWVSKDFYKILYNAATADKANPYDIVKGALICHAGNSNSYWPHGPIKVSGGRAPYVYESFRGQHFTGIFKRRLLAEHPDARYGNMLSGEDTLFLLKIGFYAKTFGFKRNAEYFYRIRSGSLSQIKESELFREYFKSLKEQLKFYFRHTKLADDTKDYILFQKSRTLDNIKGLEKLYSKDKSTDTLELIKNYTSLIDPINSYLNGSLVTLY